MDRRGFQRKDSNVSCAVRTKKKAEPVLAEKKLRKRLLFLITVLFAVGAVFFFKHRQVLNQVSLSRVKKVSIEGNQSLSKNEILSLLKLKKGDALSKDKIALVKEKLLKHPRLAQVSISNNLSGDVKVFVKERVPLALYQVGSKTLLLDSEGQSLGFVSPTENISNYFMIEGPWTSKNLNELAPKFDEVRQIVSAFMGDAQLGKIYELQFDANTGWNVLTQNLSFPIVVGNRFDIEKIRRLKQVLTKIQDQLLNVAKVDLDFEDRVVVKMKEAA